MAKSLCLTAAALALALVSGAQALCYTTWEDASCSVAITDSGANGCLSNGVCKNQIIDGNQASVQFACSDTTASSAWAGSFFVGSGCSGMALVSETGTGSSECVHFNDAGSGIEFYMKVDCSASCFSGNAKATLRGGAEKAVSNLEVNDQVLSVDASGRPFYDKVFRVTHNDQEQTTQYVRLTTANGKTVEMSFDHYLFKDDCCSLSNASMAGDVQEGDFIYTATEQDRVMATRVTKVETFWTKGAYNVHTLNGVMLVNGVVATHFSSDSKWTYPQFAPAYYKAVDAVRTLTGLGAKSRQMAVDEAAAVRAHPLGQALPMPADN